MVENLCTLYAHLRQSIPRTIEEYQHADGTVRRRETNGFDIFVYNADFDPQRFDIGLRYNESWSEDESTFGPKRSLTRLDVFVIDGVAFSNDWRDAASVPPLKSICPPIPNQEQRMARGIGNKEIEEAVVTNGPVQIIVTESAKLESYVRMRNGATFYVVTNAGIKQYKAKQLDWIVTDWTPESEE